MRSLKFVLKAFLLFLALVSTVYFVIVVALSFLMHDYAEIHPDDYYDDDDC